VHDSTDRAQIQELIINSELADRAQAAGVQTIVEGPGHIPIDEIEANVKVMKRMTNERPFYMLGPLVTDIAPAMIILWQQLGPACPAPMEQTSYATSRRQSILHFPT
jgi:phosphomethylpyrimidine synthase